VNETGFSMLNKSCAVAFLIVNRIEKLPEVAISSVLEKCSADIIIGYVNELDLPSNISNERIKTVKLSPSIDLLKSISLSSKDYVDFSRKEFFQLVQLKWLLFETILSQGYEYVVYSDTDVIWLKNPIPSLITTFEKNQKVHLQVQSFTNDPSKVELCMGFIAIRNSELALEFFEKCKEHHKVMLLRDPNFGDDNVVTDLFNILDQPTFIRELPQVTFPVGNLLNLYSKKNLFPGLTGPSPFIFHANYVVGLKQKLRLLQVFNKAKPSDRNDLNMRLGTLMYLKLVSFKLYLYSKIKLN
jgi:hypothetical protein